MSTNSFDREFVITNLETCIELISDNNPCTCFSAHFYSDNNRQRAEKLLKRCLSNSRK